MDTPPLVTLVNMRLCIGAFVCILLFGFFQTERFSSLLLSEHPKNELMKEKSGPDCIRVPRTGTRAPGGSDQFNGSAEDSHGNYICPRAFLPWNSSNSFPCFEKNNSWHAAMKNELAKTGIFLIKNPKAASTTSLSVTLRLATRMGRNMGVPFCDSRFRHGTAIRMQYDERDRNKSFLWSVVRDPSEQIISRYYHFHISRKQNVPSDLRFVNYVKTNERDFRSRYLNPDRNISVLLKPDMATRAIMSNYDFVGVTERMDESVVAMQLLLGLETADVMFFSSKKNGGFDGGAFHHTCFLIHPKEVSKEMKEFLNTTYFQEIVYWDRVLHEAASASLDKTIETIGREKFAVALEKFQKTRDYVNSYCADKVRVPCTAPGPPVKDTDCLFLDGGCGFECMDEAMEIMEQR